MNAFRDGTWEQRFSKMGDEAEGRFEKYASDVLGLGFVRKGLSRPPIQLSSVPARIRYEPDYLMSKNLVEVQGVGRDQIVKVKLDKWNCLCFWNGIHPVMIYVWDSHKQRECLFPLFNFEKLIAKGKGSLGVFAEGKPYFAFAADDIFALAA